MTTSVTLALNPGSKTLMTSSRRAHVGPCTMQCNQKLLKPFLLLPSVVRATSASRGFHTCPAVLKNTTRQTRDYLDFVNKTKIPMAHRSKQNFDYFVVLDFEATCDNQTTLRPQVKTLLARRGRMSSERYCHTPVVVVVVDNFRLKFLFINLSQVKVSVY